MKTYVNAVALIGIALLLPAPAAFAQERPAYAPERPANTQARPAFRQEQLDQMLAPIALYPDSLLSQILMAATYPLEVVQAARWSKANPGVAGADAVKAVEPMNWDPSVKSLVAFPEVLAMMDERLDWTEQLGEAFLAQQPQVMDAIQGLRRRAEAAGNLGPDERMAVRRRDDYIMIEPTDPQVVHVPYYNPRVVYGPWWAPDYPPVYWGPPAAYYYGGPAYWGPGFLWGPGIAVVPGFFFGAFVWPHRHVTVVYSDFYRGYYARRGIVWTRPGAVAWRHDTFHRRSVPYRQAVLRQQFVQARTSNVETRRRANEPATAPVVRPAQGERAREQLRDRRSEQRVEPAARQPAARQSRQEAPPPTRSTTNRTDAPAARPAQDERTRELRDRRSEQRGEPAARQSRREAPAASTSTRSTSTRSTTNHADAPAANRRADTRRSTETPSGRRPDAERRDASRLDRNTRRGAAAAAGQRPEQNRQQHRS